MKLLYVGSADLSGKVIGGQLEKTRLLYEALKNNKYIEVYFANMFCNRSKIKLVKDIVVQYFKSDVVIFVTSGNGTKLFTRLFYYLKKISKKPVLFIVVGNQDDLIKELPKKYMASLERCYFEIEKMRDNMMPYVKADYLTNCKNIREIKDTYMAKAPYKICYYSEISKRKGFDIIVSALKEINKYKVQIILDVYGYFGTDEPDMKALLDLNKDFVEFKGALNRESAQDILSHHLFMIFPSRHPLEGVPGAIIDAYEAALPVITSDVSYLSYIVKDGETGFVYHNEEELIKLISSIIDNPDCILKMRKSCLEHARRYDLNVSMSKLMNDLNHVKKFQ